MPAAQWALSWSDHGKQPKAQAAPGGPKAAPPDRTCFVPVGVAGGSDVEAWSQMDLLVCGVSRPWDPSTGGGRSGCLLL